MITIIESSLPWVNLSIFLNNKIETEKTHLITSYLLYLLWRVSLSSIPDDWKNSMQMRTTCASSSSSSVCLWTHCLTPPERVDYYAIRLVSYRFTSTIKSGLRFCLMMMMLLLYWEMSGASIPNGSVLVGWYFSVFGVQNCRRDKIIAHFDQLVCCVLFSVVYVYSLIITHIRTVCYNLI